MACSVKWTRAAEHDRDEIIEYLLFALSSKQAATGFMDSIDRAIGLLEETPTMHPACAEPRLAALGYRKCPLGRYVLLYKVVDDTVYLARIFHMSQDYARLL